MVSCELEFVGMDSCGGKGFYVVCHEEAVAVFVLDSPALVGDEEVIDERAISIGNEIDGLF